MDDSFKSLITLLAVLIGGVLVWIGHYLSDQRKIHSEKVSALRAAYADWLTSVTMLKHRFMSLIPIVSKIASSRAEYTLVVDEMDRVLSSINDCYHSLHKIYLLDKIRERKEAHRLFTKQLDLLFQGVQSQVTHIRSHIELKEKFDEINHDLENQSQLIDQKAIIRDNIDKLIKERKEHDLSCESSISEILTDLQESVRKLDNDNDLLLNLLSTSIDW